MMIELECYFTIWIKSLWRWWACKVWTIVRKWFILTK